MKSQTSMPLFEALCEYHRKNVIPFDVPGHKHGRGIPQLVEFLGETTLQVDVNSMKSLDSIGNPIGVIKQAQNLAAKAFGARECFFMVNGTTSAVQAMIMSVCKPGEKIILPRNAHKSAINGLVLSGAIPVYIQPGVDERLGIANGVKLEDVKKAIRENPDAKALFLINPTYYGMTSNIKEIVNEAHSNSIAVLVDEAHGAHLHFHEQLPVSAMEAGADMSAVSMHKTGGSLTQSSLLLVKNRLVDNKFVRIVIKLTLTTSASYLLMSSLDVARRNLAVEGKEIMDRVLKISRNARKEINDIEGLYAFGGELVNGDDVFSFDETKLGICVSEIGLTGFEMYDILRDEYNIQMEMADAYNVLAIISIGDTEGAVQKLVEALSEISKKYRRENISTAKPILKNPEVVVSPRDAFYSCQKTVRLERAIGQISGEAVMAYPPGIPIFAMGERITSDMVEYIKFLKSQNASITGTEDPGADYIKVLGM
ncbi:Arginine/lysine/ornithine decarboxylase [Peptoclostridium litorale DSM 5388]|uniref:Arginine decarboxylase SpeA n=1 Tax=Peptoclostridium litorale DSM 5388 TaxID=1121324 RepID=A0A069REV6_PEPLI|nr:aminotransferase class I/II-fold pyridoxal phosphate-dependent enzyme [Peptoclostridium litorale]KDR94730.1 arginine decarboxylase SpeA [Peptoclostridium litorale DSM 5388]SIO33251.1 Arginine/lysine/ornithine decarboxylase [Peptoclostridium litorale DSM 5388]